LRMRDQHRREALARLRLAERPDRLVAVRRGDRHAYARAGAVGVALVVERDRHLDVALPRQWLDVRLAQAQDGLERRALLRVQLALVSAQPAVLDERLLAVRPDLADRRLEVDARLRGAHPRVDRARADDGRVLGQ